MVEQALSTQPWWQDLPFWTIILSFIAFSAGAVIQDLYNKNSWIYENLREINKSADLLKIQIVENESPATHVSIIINLKFTREIKDGRIYITVYPLYANIRSFVIFDDKNLNLPPDSEKKISICHERIPMPGEPPVHSLWGESIGGVDLREGDKTVMPHSRNLVKVTISNGRRNQNMWFMLHLLNRQRMGDTTVYTMPLDEVVAEDLYVTR